MASLTKVFVHLVWAVDDRRPMIRKQYRPELARFIKQRCEFHNVSPIAIGVVSDHMHLLVRFRLSMSISDFVQDIKGASSHYMNEHFELPELFRWQGGYSAWSVSPELLDSKIDYVRAQESKHIDMELAADAYWSDRQTREEPLQDRDKKDLPRL